MKLVVAIVQDQDASSLIEDLTEKEFRVTKLASTGGFLKAGNTTLLSGVEDDKVNEVIKVIEDNCRTREITTSLLTGVFPIIVPFADIFLSCNTFTATAVANSVIESSFPLLLREYSTIPQNLLSPTELVVTTTVGALFVILESARYSISLPSFVNNL